MVEDAMVFIKSWPPSNAANGLGFIANFWPASEMAFQ
jgi:hypothetical protein